MLLIAVTGLLVAAFLAFVIGARLQRRAVAASIDRITRAAVPVGPHPERGLDNLPPPVSRYLRWALEEAPSARLVRIGQIGTLRTDTSSDRWMPFEAEHLIAPGAIGFFWNARVTAIPLLHLRVRDAFIAGNGSGHVSLWSAFPVSSAMGTPEMNAGSLHRFLAEAVWYPAALLPSAKLRWEPLDASRALATLTEHGVSVSLEFRFADTGDVTSIYTPTRWGTFGGDYEQRPWEGHFRDYQRRGGMWVPREGDVGWYVGAEWHPVWRGTIVGYEIE